MAEAAKYGASVEAEIGSMGAREGGDGVGAASIYTDPDAAVKFVAETGIDALACAFGTSHGFYKDAPKLDFDRVEKINSMIDVPIVMHGGSGVSGWSTETVTFTIYIDDLTDSIYIRYGASGEGDDTWYNKNVKVTITAVK